MRSDKSYIQYQGQSQLQRAYSLLAPLVDQCYVSIRATQQPDPLRSTFPCIVDVPGCEGPAAGLLAAQRSRPDAGWLVVACDLPLLDQATLETLIAARFVAGDVTLYGGFPDARPEPLCAIWEASSAGAIEDSLVRGNGSFQQALKGLRVRLLEIDAHSALTNVNTPTDVQRARQALAESASSQDDARGPAADPAL